MGSAGVRSRRVGTEARLKIIWKTTSGRALDLKKVVEHRPEFMKGVGPHRGSQQSAATGIGAELDGGTSRPACKLSGGGATNL